MRTKIIALLFTLLPIASFAQEKLYSVKGCVMARYSENKLAAEPFMNVILMDTTERIHIGGCQTDLGGKYYIDSIPNGRYTLTFRGVGFERFDTVLTISSNCYIDTLEMYNRWYSINGNRIWERQLKIATPNYIDSYREIYIDYRKAVNSLNKTLNKKNDELIDSCKAVKSVRNIDTILTHLKGVSMKTGYVLDVVYSRGGLGGIAHYYCREADKPKQRKKLSLKKSENILDYMNVEFTPEGIWSAYLLNISYSYIFKFWHAYYSESWQVFSVKDEIICSLSKYDTDTEDSTTWKELSVLPPIKNKVEIIDSNNASITSYYWNEWEGLIEEKLHVERVGETVRFIRYDKDNPDSRTSYKVLVFYWCGIQF